jgi:hypothetical protein
MKIIAPETKKTDDQKIGMFCKYTIPPIQEIMKLNKIIAAYTSTTTLSKLTITVIERILGIWKRQALNGND